MKVELKMGERVVVNLEGTDGEFVISYGRRVLQVTADLPDTSGRKGVIYAEKFGQLIDKYRADGDEPVPAERV
jgi:hypothetical protein